MFPRRALYILGHFRSYNHLAKMSDSASRAKAALLSGIVADAAAMVRDLTSIEDGAKRD